jgi:hypothetical protein
MFASAKHSTEGGAERGDLLHSFAFGRLPRQEERLDQFAVAADCHAREALVPLAIGNIWFGVEPSREQYQLLCWNLAALYAIEEMLKESWRETLPANLRHDVRFRRIRASIAL